jgi:hypothetical protein
MDLLPPLTNIFKITFSKATYVKFRSGTTLWSDVALDVIEAFRFRRRDAIGGIFFVAVLKNRHLVPGHGWA